MKALIDFIPLILFFIAYKNFGSQVAAATLVITTILQLIITKIFFKKIEKLQLFTALAIVIFGSLTVYFNNDSFLKWKVTLAYLAFAIAFIVSQVFFKKTLIENFIGKEFQLAPKIWKQINIAWAIFFLLLAGINWYISTFLSDDLWYSFKTFGFPTLTIIATGLTGIFIYFSIKKEQ